MNMTVNETAEGVTHVLLDGRFDIKGSQAVDAKFAEIAEKARILVVDLTKVSFVASLGVRTLMLSAKTIIRRGEFVAVAGANKGVERVLRLTGFDELVGLYPDYASAAAALTARAQAFESRKT